MIVAHQYPHIVKAFHKLYSQKDKEKRIRRISHDWLVMDTIIDNQL